MATLTSRASYDFAWWQFILITAVAIAAGVLTEKLTIKRLLLYSVIIIGLLFTLSLVFATQFSFRFFFLRTAFVVFSVILVVHLKRLWLLDSELTKKLNSFAVSGQLLGGRSADLRIENGLKLLETIYPLSEAIVFKLDEQNRLSPIARSRDESINESFSTRQSAWREGVELCYQVIEAQQTVVSVTEDKNNPAQVAVPLVYEDRTIGALYIRIARNFERADRYLLEGFSEQMSRNLQRLLLGHKELPNRPWETFFSIKTSQDRVDAVSLIEGLMEEQRFGAMASSHLKEAHAIAYLDGTLAYLNRRMRHLAKLDSQQISELDLFGLLEKFKTEVFNEPQMAIRRVLQTGDKFNCELHFPAENKTLDMQIALVKVPAGEQSIHDTNTLMKPACFLLTFRDITAIKENEKLRSDMVSLMSHELRTPITSINGFAELLLADEKVPEEAREFLTIISSESQRLSKMLSTFLSVSNLEQSDKQELVKSPVKLDTVVHEVVNEMQNTAKQKRILLVEKPGSHVPPVAADKGLIRNAITNLIDNAIKYSPEKTSVIISTILEADFLRVEVEDRGYGVPRAEQEKIWQKFYRVAREGHDKQESSTGLGLSFVKEVVEQHGGNIELKSELNQGSKFSFTLPRL